MSVGSILKNKVREGNFSKMVKKINKDSLWRIAYNDKKKGRILLGCDPAKVRVDIMRITSQFIHCEVVDREDNHKFAFTIMYAFNTIGDRLPFWVDKCEISKCTHCPWITQGT